jgi:hypothetical protein
MGVLRIVLYSIHDVFGVDINTDKASDEESGRSK